MKLIVTKYETEIAYNYRYEVCFRKDGINEFVYTFDTKKEMEAFCSGFNMGKTVANNLIQSMPMGYEMGGNKD